jgi:hypothetical protein
VPGPTASFDPDSKERSRVTGAVLTEFSDGIAVITINRPAACNAVNARRGRGNRRSLGEAASGRFVLGIGASSSAVVKQWNGIPYY